MKETVKDAEECGLFDFTIIVTRVGYLRFVFCVLFFCFLYTTRHSVFSSLQSVFCYDTAPVNSTILIQTSLLVGLRHFQRHSSNQ
jgi:hypothetical protein